MPATTLPTTVTTPYVHNGQSGTAVAVQQEGESLSDLVARNKGTIPSGAVVGQSTLSTPVLCDGVVTIVTTTQNVGESDSDFIDRHLAKVRAKVDECD